MTNWTDLFGDITVAQAITWFLALVAFTLLAIRGWKLLGSLKDFMDDVKGEPARPGVAARPGLMERVGTIETKVDAVSTSLSEVRHEVLPNTGTSLRDAADRTESRLASVDDKVDTLTADMASVHSKLDNDNQRIDELAEFVHREDKES
ncbi:hypothetical protein [uncultured Microbacterium sp.]|uniref:hypothetical protein n=1 Tax=uncultured Microbacterium sp. TaxID=191216 RepID=UPI0025F9AAC0|nr:hypothetical protein [uncultured Microbacterium sp.]